MRTIKMRAWCAGSMWLVSNIELWKEPELYPKGKKVPSPLKVHLVKILPEQEMDVIYKDGINVYTDFKLMECHDGIFEGDILEYKNLSECYVVNFLFEVIKDEHDVWLKKVIKPSIQAKEIENKSLSELMVEQEKGKIYLIDNIGFPLKKCKVIGNIYENKSLLKEQL